MKSSIEKTFSTENMCRYICIGINAKNERSIVYFDTFMPRNWKNNYMVVIDVFKGLVMWDGKNWEEIESDEL
jgi:hypothetical protein